MNEALQKIVPLIAIVSAGENLTAEESEKIFKTIFLYDTDGYHFAVFMSALHAKGETADELVGLINAYKNLATPLNISANPAMVTDLSGTGAGKIKTMNVSTAASFIVAAAGYTVGKASYFGVTSPTGSADIFAALGIDIAKLDKKTIETTLEEIHICPFYVPFFSPNLVNRGNLFKKVYRDTGIKVSTTAHLATNAFSPFLLKQRIYGCYSEKYLEVLAEMFAKLNFTRTLVFSSEIGIPEIVNVGKTRIVEQNGDNIKSYYVSPKDLGVKTATIEEIQATSKDQNIIDFLCVLQTKNRNAKEDLVIINAGAGLYALKDVETIQEGVIKARAILSSGAAYEVLQKLVKNIGNFEMLQTLNRKIY